jgi:glyoxylase-like metal-dependent hydrolase (beta-lactamase superfamily II)/ferredoxin
MALLLGMAKLSEAVPDNAAGEFFVDRSCIDCDACRQIAPEVFSRSSRTGLSRIERQPADPQRALMALVSCPTSSIGTVHKLDPRTAIEALPERIDEGVYFCGFCSEKSFGALSYLIVRPEGNVLVDSPRANPPLFHRLERLGGVRWLFLSHRDDVADHARIAEHFGATRVIHEADARRGLESVERRISGVEPIPLAPDVKLIPVPGHTRGSTALLLRDKYLFTGDHLAWDDDDHQLTAWRDVCWYSWEEQTRSMERLLSYSFEWVLPGHGRRHREAAPRMRRELESLVARMKAA